MLQSPLVWFAIAFVLTLVSVWAARRIAISIGFVARPNPIVLAHREPVPYLGGLALFAVYALLAIALPGVGGPGSGAWMRALAALALALVGTWDDRRPFSPRWKFLAQGVIAAAYLWARGVTDPLLFAGELFAFLVLSNAFNLIDVMDGLLCLVSALAIAGLLWTPGLAPAGLAPELVLGLGCVAGLFAFNRPPARIYGGDAGSLAMGFLIGAWALEAAHPAAPLVRVSLLGLLALPLFELSLLMIARARRGMSPFRGSPDHFSLRLQDQLGWSKERVLLAVVVGGGFAALAPMVALRAPQPLALIFAAAVVVASLLAWWRVWRIPPQIRPAQMPATSPTPGPAKS